jgi:hypothetical protein
VTISANPIGAWVTSRRLIPMGERSGLQTRIATMGKRFVVHADEKLTALLELKSAIGRIVSRKTNGESEGLKLQRLLLRL